MYKIIKWQPEEQPMYLGEYGEFAELCANLAPEFIVFNPIGFKKSDGLKNEVIGFCEREGFRFVEIASEKRSFIQRIKKGGSRYNIIAITCM